MYYQDQAKRTRSGGKEEGTGSFLLTAARWLPFPNPESRVHQHGCQMEQQTRLSPPAVLRVCFTASGS